MNLKGLVTKAGVDILEEVKILSLTLKAQEGEFMQIELFCEKKNLNSRFLTLTFDEVVFFKGYILGGVEYVEPDCMKLIYVGRGLGRRYAIPQEESLLNKTVLQKWELPFVDPITHDMQNIPMLSGDIGKDITPYVLMDSPKVEQIRVPFQNIKITVHATWVQRGQGAINLFPYIKKAFPARRVLSMTGDALKASFPSIGQTLGKKMGRKTGYTVLSSKMVPCSSKAFNTVPMKIKGREFFLPIKEYKGHFWVQWSCAYIREETLELLLSWKNGEYMPLNQAGSVDAWKVFNFTVKKSAIAEGNDTFFDTQAGQLSIRQAVEQSIYAGLQSRQAYLLKVDMPFVSSLKYKVGNTVIFAKSTTEIIRGRVARL